MRKPSSGFPTATSPTISLRRIAEKTPARMEVGLPDESLVFCCFNNPAKITPEVFVVWDALVGSRTALRAVGFSMTTPRQLGGCGSTRHRTASTRNGSSSRRGCRRRSISRVSALLICFSTRGRTTPTRRQVIALWAGLPVLTLQGDTFASRVAASLLRAVGLPELITDSVLRIRGASDLARLPPRATGRHSHPTGRAAFRLTHCSIRGRFTRNLEAGYEAAWARHCEGLPPGVLDITEA